MSWDVRLWCNECLSVIGEVKEVEHYANLWRVRQAMTEHENEMHPVKKEA